MIELYKIFAGKYDSEITEWTGKWVQKEDSMTQEMRYYDFWQQVKKSTYSVS